MKEFKGTNINMHVRPDTKWPFDIVIYDDRGNEVFRENLYAHSTGQKSFEDTKNAVGFDFDEREEIKAVIERQLADAQIRAVAPQLLDALQKCKRVLAAYNSDKAIDAHYIASEAIKKALGQ